MLTCEISPLMDPDSGDNSRFHVRIWVKSRHNKLINGAMSCHVIHVGLERWKWRHGPWYSWLCWRCGPTRDHSIFKLEKSDRRDGKDNSLIIACICLLILCDESCRNLFSLSLNLINIAIDGLTRWLTPTCSIRMTRGELYAYYSSKKEKDKPTTVI